VVNSGYKISGGEAWVSVVIRRKNVKGNYDSRILL
jgi:hypothetical protein